LTSQDSIPKLHSTSVTALVDTDIGNIASKNTVIPTKVEVDTLNNRASQEIKSKPASSGVPVSLLKYQSSYKVGIKPGRSQRIADICINLSYSYL
jgi:hypothetical protein